MSLNQGKFFPQGTFGNTGNNFGYHNWARCWYLAGKKPGLLLNIFQCGRVGEGTTKNYRTQMSIMSLRRNCIDREHLFQHTASSNISERVRNLKGEAFF